MNTCRTCKHYRHIRNEDYQDWEGPHGECHRITERTEGNSAWLALEENADCDHDLSLIVKPDFGCILHEPATPEPEQT